jgi:hypothetical protein
MAARLRKSLIVALAGGLVAGAFVAPAVAKKKAKPVATTLYMHGTQVIGEAESSPQVADAPLPMDATEPTGAEPKSHGIANGLVTPNHQCAGNNLFPVFVGNVSGRIVGDMTVTLHALSTPGGSVDVRVWNDKLGLLCTSEASGTQEYPEPVAEQTVALPAGPGAMEVTFEDLDFLATTNLMIQVTPAVAADLPTPDPAPDTVFGPFVARVLYDSTDYPSNVTFQCIPAKGKSCTP